TLALPGGEAILIDESYNANPASMRAALALLGQAPVAPSGRRIAVIGDMLELGTHGPDLHRDLVEPVLANAVDLVFCAGPLMHELWQALPSERRGAYAETAATLEAKVVTAVRAGDAVMVKGSLGSRMGPIVKALERRYDRHAAGEPPAAQGRTRLYWLIALSDRLSVLNVFRYLTFRAVGAVVTALIFVFLFGPTIINLLRVKQGKGQPIRADGPESHLVTKKGTPTMGGLMILSGLLVSTLLWAN